MSVRQQLDHFAERRRRANGLGPHFQASELIDGPRVDRVAFPLVDGHALARQDGLVDGRSTDDHDAVGRDLLTGTDDQHVANTKSVGRDLHFLAVSRDRRTVVGRYSKSF